ncbi:MAG TPA: DMT family transporter [Gemmatimonas sp.]|uniref:DMT family transporter n=1 Tax=Gemmatimonas sp. TaxID=1962908 RepID=UPI002EDBA821
MTHVTASYEVPKAIPSWKAAVTGDFGLIVVPGAIWGASFLFIAQGLHAVGPHGVAFFRILAGFLALLAFPAARKSIDRAAWPRIAVLAVLWMAVPLTLFPYAEQRISSAMAGMLNGAVPLFATAVAAIIAQRLPSRTILTGLAVGMTGVVLVALPNLQGGGASADGVLLVLAAVTLYAISINVARPLQMEYGALPVLLRALGLAAVLTAPLGIPEVLDGHWTLAPVLSLLTLGVFGTGIAYVLGTMAAGKLGAAKASASIFITAPVALMLGVVVLGESVALLSVVGAAACIAGAMIIRRADSAR